MALSKNKEFALDIKSSNTSILFSGTYDEVMKQLKEFQTTHEWGTTTIVNMSVMVSTYDEVDPLTGQKVDVTCVLNTCCKYDTPVDELNAVISLVQKNYLLLD